jgi:hypothetical protein
MPSRSSPDRDERGHHGARRLPTLEIEHYNVLLRDPDGDGFLGDRASQTAFRELLDTARREHRTGEDPFGDGSARDLSKKAIDRVLVGGAPDETHLVHLAVEEYARRLSHVIRAFLVQPQWKGVERIVLGGGFQESETGSLCVRRAVRLLQHEDCPVKLTLLRHDADEGGLLGWVPLLPEPHRDCEAFLAVDVGGTNIRCGIVEPRLHKDPDGGKARVVESMKWRHADDAPDRGEAVRRTGAMLNALSSLARTLGLRLAPFVGIACPGQVEADGTLSHGAQNLPGNWEHPFHLPDALGACLDPIGGRAPDVVLHNDAVVQGLSECKRMRKARHWAVLTIGTGLGNACYRWR